MEVCRLCLQLLPDNNYIALDGSMKDMVLIVSRELNLEISQSPVACIDCSGHLEELFLFKTKCFENEELIRTKVCEEEKNKFSIKEILNGPSSMSSLCAETAQDRMCRLCLEPIECESFTILKPSEPDAYLSSMLLMCLPEIELDLSVGPVMCETCFDSLQKLHQFKSTCLDVDEKLANFGMRYGTSSSSQINLHNVLELDSQTVNVKSEVNLNHISIKKEYNEDEDEFQQPEADYGNVTDMYDEDHKVTLKQEEVDLKPDFTDIPKKQLHLQKWVFFCGFSQKGLGAGAAASTIGPRGLRHADEDQ